MTKVIDLGAIAYTKKSEKALGTYVRSAFTQNFKFWLLSKDDLSFLTDKQSSVVFRKPSLARPGNPGRIFPVYSGWQRVKAPTCSTAMDAVGSCIRDVVEQLRYVIRARNEEVRETEICITDWPKLTVAYPEDTGNVKHSFRVEVQYGIAGMMHLPGDEPGPETTPRKINKDDKERMWSEIHKSGWAYTFDGYHDWADVPDPKLHVLINAWNEAPKEGNEAWTKLRQYIWYKGCEEE